MREIRKIVQRIVKKYGTNDPRELCDYLNVLVRIADIGDVLGCYFLIKRQKCIMLNAGIIGTPMEKMVLGHELGHSVLHRNNNCYFYGKSTFFLKSKTELEANKFAAELLLPDDIFIEYQEYTTWELSRITGYSKELIELRIK